MVVMTGCIEVMMTVMATNNNRVSDGVDSIGDEFVTLQINLNECTVGVLFTILFTSVNFIFETNLSNYPYCISINWNEKKNNCMLNTLPAASRLYLSTPPTSHLLDQSIFSLQ